MPLTCIRIGRLFDADPRFTILFIRLMAAVDDFNTVISSMERLPKPASRATELRISGKRLYYFRLACGHLDETIHIVKHMQNEFSQLLVQGPPSLAEAYTRIATTISPLEDMLARMRNNAVLRCDDSELIEVLQEWGTDSEGMIVTGEGLDQTRHSVADEALSRNIRRIFGFPSEIEEHRRAFEDLINQLMSLQTDLMVYVHWLLDAVAEIFPGTIESL